jgi:hypothetical protein
VADLADRRAARLRVLKTIYDEAAGSILNDVAGQWLLDKTGFADTDLADICNYLEGERWIKPLRTLWGHATPMYINLTHQGIKKMESLSDSELEALEHPVADLDLGLVGELLRLWESAGEAVELPADDASQLAAEMRTVKAQVELPRPNLKSIRAHLETARQILIAAAGGAAAIGLIDLIDLILRVAR